MNTVVTTVALTEVDLDAQWHQVYLGLGSNLQQPVKQLDSARHGLAALPHSRLALCSAYYRNPPLGGMAQPDYVNAVCLLQTRLRPLPLLRQLQALEKASGRVRDGVRWGPRTLDLDILLYDDLSLAEPQLVIPHPQISRRAFVLLPLLEIAPLLEVPGQGSVRQLAAAVADTEMRRIS